MERDEESATGRGGARRFSGLVFGFELVRTLSAQFGGVRRVVCEETSCASEVSLVETVETKWRSPTLVLLKKPSDC